MFVYEKKTEMKGGVLKTEAHLRMGMRLQTGVFDKKCKNGKKFD